jgi:hypothetical protein
LYCRARNELPTGRTSTVVSVETTRDVYMCYNQSVVIQAFYTACLFGKVLNEQILIASALLFLGIVCKS